MYLFEAEIIEKWQLAADIFRLRLRAGEEFIAAGRPGRFVMLAPVGGLYDPLLRRPFGIVRCGDGWFEVVIKAVGKGSRNLVGLPAGAGITVHGPLGNGWPQDESGEQPLILVAGGIGIAAIAPVIFARRAESETFLLYGAATKDELVLLDEFTTHDGRGPQIEVITDDGSCGRRGLVTELLLEKLEEYPGARVFACGPEPMLKGVQKVLRERDIEGWEGWLSLENRMACGFGVCLGCVQKTGSEPETKTSKVCTEGPVFAAGEVIFDD
ncbi:MAG: dihydroorotate dehydrogenase electron transfer subunit [Deltaproteobacteria bacterium]|nr:dihydroorotate dehydrogenase electron transfer subunit [Deltaproteobacteria bacterium]